MTDDEAFAHYSLSENQEPGTRVIRRTGLGSHVPVRFSQEAVAQVKTIAERNGMTVSSWIRRIIMREVERRQQTTAESTALRADPEDQAEMKSMAAFIAAVRGHDPGCSNRVTEMLHFELVVNQWPTGLRFSALRTSNTDCHPNRDDVSTYEVTIGDWSGAIDHRYGDGAWTLVSTALNQMLAEVPPPF